MYFLREDLSQRIENILKTLRAITDIELSLQVRGRRAVLTTSDGVEVVGLRTPQLFYHRH